MSRLRTGHGPDDWELLPPYEAEFQLGRTGPIGGGPIEARPAIKGLTTITPHERARRIRRTEQARLERIAKQVEGAA